MLIFNILDLFHNFVIQSYEIHIIYAYKIVRLPIKLYM